MKPPQPGPVPLIQPFLDADELMLLEAKGSELLQALDTSGPGKTVPTSFLCRVLLLCCSYV